ncbi:MAG: hypothetical protein HY516_04135 [Candidatus Aenigmarchaeota archaeon]|nr:hypothetical protein [Candidatus Aenigmarchaeota archaeon]
MSVTGKITGLTMVVAGFTFFAWFIALNTISPSIPEGLQGTAKLFMVLSAVTGLGFLVSGGMAFFGHEQHSEEQNTKKAEKAAEKGQFFKSLPKPASNPPATQDVAEKESEDVVIEVDEEKKKDGDNKAGWEAPSNTGWG